MSTTPPPDGLAAAADLVPLVMTLVSVLIVAVEWRSLARRGLVERHKEGVVNVLSAVLNFIPLFALNIAFVYGAMFALYEHRVAELGFGWWVWLLAWVAYDLANYVLHYLEHKVRLLWCVHAVHHQPLEIKASVSFRGSWTEWLVMPHLVLWLPLLGFHPHLVLVVEGVALLYGVPLHLSEHVVKGLGDRVPAWLGRVFITPQAHRLHHARNDLYLDTNYGLSISLWDRLFRTWQAREAEEEPVYGLTKELVTDDLWVAQMDEWQCLWRDLRSTRNPLHQLGYLFLPPGWSPDGDGTMAHQLRRRALAQSAARKAVRASR